MRTRLLRYFALVRASATPTHLLIAIQSLFLFLGLTHWDFNVTVTDIAVVLATAISAEYILARKVYFPGSTIAAALGIAIFFRAVHPSLFALAGLIAVASKYVLRSQGGGHIFNPSNIAIVSLVFTLPTLTTIEFTQWGGDPYEYAAVALASFLVAYRAGVLRTTLSFFGSYVALLFILVPFFPDAMSVHYYGIFGPSLVLFASFMITDPKTSPTAPRERVLHGVAVALLLAALEIIGVRYAIFLSAFLITLSNAVVRASISGIAGRVLGEMPRNLPTFAVVTLVFICAAVTNFSGDPPFSSARLSLDFLVRGIESPQELRCSPNAVYEPSDRAHFSEGSYTFGSAWGDYDGDGYDDLFVSNIGAGPSRLYKNAGDGTFTDVTEVVGLPLLPSSSAVFADYDNDGRLDLFVAAAGSSRARAAGRFSEALEMSQAIRVYRNVGRGSFRDVTGTIGLGSFELHNRLAGAFSFADYDKDGDLDLVFVSSSYAFPAARTNSAQLKSLFDPRFNYVTKVVCDAGEMRRMYEGLGKRAIGSQSDLEAFISGGGCFIVNDSLGLVAKSGASWSPHEYIIDILGMLPGSAHLFENRNGRYVEHTDFESGILGSTRTSDYGVSHYTKLDGASRHYFQPVSFDYDMDGDLDIVITVGWGTNLVARNDGRLDFANATVESGLDYGGSGMGVSVSDHDGDGTLDMIITNVLGDYLFASDGEGMFTLEEDAIAALGLGWGVAFVDYDLDGHDDIFAVNGDVPRTAEQTERRLGRSLFRTNRLYKNLGEGRYIERTWTDMCPDSQSSKTLAVSDFDNNGTPDVFVGNLVLPGSEANTDILYLDKSTGRSYLKVRLRGTKSNSHGIGAVVSVASGGTVQTKLVSAGGGFYSQDSSRLVFGLGTSTEPVDVRVTWPSGRVTETQDVPVDREVTIVER